MKKFNLLTLATFVVALLFTPSAHAESLSVDFENPPYNLGVINAQNGWSSTGAAGSGCAIYDHAVNSSLGTTGFGTQSLRLSNAVTSGCFGDQTFSLSLLNESGESGSTNGAMSGGVRQNHFEAQFDFASTQLAEQPGLFVSVSPDRGDGSRMSYLGFGDTASGIDVTFYDVQGENAGFQAANFVATTVASGLSRSIKHTAKLVIDYVGGPSNDIVKVYIDGVLVHTGTTWENYYRFDTEASAEQTTRTTDSLLFRTGGVAVPANDDKGFLFDNLSLFSGSSTVKVTINKFVEGTNATSITANSSDFPMSATWNAANIGAGTGSYVLGVVGHNTANAYEAVTSDMTIGSDYSTNEVTGGAVVGASCSTGQPFALTGYTTGDTFSAAQSGTPSLIVPSFTNLLSNKYVIVWNEECPTPTPTVTVTPTPDPFAVPLACAATGNTYGSPIIGTNDSNRINGTPGNDLIFSLGGSDKVDGKGGNDCIVGGDGSDKLIGGSGLDVLIGGDDSDALEGGSESDKLYGDNGSDSLKGGSGNDFLYGGAQGDSLKGESGDDTLDGEADVDSANGGSGGADVCTAESESSCEL
jgi:Ca2+-binding RTX toxin-like protein